MRAGTGRACAFPRLIPCVIADGRSAENDAFEQGGICIRTRIPAPRPPGSRRRWPAPKPKRWT